MARKTYSEEVKAAAMASLLEGQSVGHVADEYQIPKGTVSGWRRKALEGVAPDATKKTSVGDLLFSYLETNLETLRKQSEFFSDKEWLKKQTASEVAVLHGVLTDKSIRLLEAMGGESEPR